MTTKVKDKSDYYGVLHTADIQWMAAFMFLI